MKDIKLKCYFCDKLLDYTKDRIEYVQHAAWIDNQGYICEPLDDYSDEEFYKYICCEKCHTRYVFAGKVYRLTLDEGFLKRIKLDPTKKAFRRIKKCSISKCSCTRFKINKR